jgi:PKD repeat protein
VTVDVLANDYDPNGDPLTVISVTQPLSGTAVVNLDDTITYTPTTGWHGSDSFTYTVGDGNGGADAATVTITVQPRDSWRYACDTGDDLLVEIIGAGMGHGSAVEHNPQTLTVDNPDDVAFVLAQVVVKKYSGVSPPDKVLISSDLETHELLEPANTDAGYYYEVFLQPTGQITAEVIGVGPSGKKTPRAFVAYVFRHGDGEQANIGGLTHAGVYHDDHTEVSIIPTASVAREVEVTFVVADMQNDSRTAVLRAQAGDVIREATVIQPNRDDELLIYTLTLLDVPGSVDIVTATLTSPSSGGDSLYWSGVNVATPCDPQAGGPEEGRVTDDLQALYAFQEGSGTTVHDVSEVGTPLDLTIADETAVTWIAGGLSIEAETIVASGVAATKVIAASRASDEVTIEAWVRPANTTQSGPARIVSLSAGPSNRNFTLGQTTDDYVVRLRTTTTGDNGANPSLSTSGGALTTDLTHVIYTRDAAGQARVYVNDVEVASEAIGGNLSNWNDTYQFILANELTEDRPWLGELHLVAIYGRALDAGEVERNYQAGANLGIQAFFEAAETGGPVPYEVTFVAQPIGEIITYTWDFGDGGDPVATVVPTTAHTYETAGTFDVTLTVEGPAGSDTWTRPGYVSTYEPGSRVTDDLQVLYTFQEGSGTTVRDVSEVGTPLDLTIADETAVSWLSGGGLAIDASTIVASSGAATKVIDAAQDTDQLTIEAWVEPANTTQDGPARIVTLSANPSYRNFTLGQGRWGSYPPDAYDVRLRTTDTSNNGTPSLTSPAGSLTTELGHVVYTRDAAGVARIYVDGVQVVDGTVGGDFSNWSSSYRLGLANELAQDRPWLGELHLVAIYNRALTPDEVSQNYNAGSG